MSAGGKALIPVFAVGRAQELLILVEEAWQRLGLVGRVSGCVDVLMCMCAAVRAHRPWRGGRGAAACCGPGRRSLGSLGEGCVAAVRAGARGEYPGGMHGAMHCLYVMAEKLGLARRERYRAVPRVCVCVCVCVCARVCSRECEGLISVEDAWQGWVGLVGRVCDVPVCVCTCVCGTVMCLV